MNMNYSKITQNSLNEKSKILNEVQLQTSGDSTTNITIWLAKKQKAQIEKNIEILKNRIYLLKHEQIKAKKKINETRIKTNEMFKLKENIYNAHLLKMSSVHKRNDSLKDKKRNSLQFRIQNKFNLSNIRQDLLEMKQQEFNTIKNISNENKNRLKYFKENELKEKQSKKILIQESHLIAKQKINYFWENKKNFYVQQHLNEAQEDFKIKENLEKELNKLENIELELVNNLQKTQDLQEKLYDKLENTILMSADDVEKERSKYCDQPNSKNIKIKKKKEKKNKFNLIDELKNKSDTAPNENIEKIDLNLAAKADTEEN